MDTLNQPQSLQPAVEQTPVPQKPSVNSKIFLIAVILFIVVMIGLITYILAAKTKSTPKPSPISPTLSQPSPTPDPTANWKTYINTKLGYIVKFPPNVDFTDTQKGEKIKTDGIPSLCCIVLSQNPGFYLSIDVSEETRTLEEYKDFFLLTENEKDRYKSYDINIVKFLNEDALTYKQATTTFYTIVKNKMRYNFATISPNDNLMNQILSTFQFSN